MVDLWPVTQNKKPITTNLLRTVDNFFIRPHLRFGYIIYLHTYHYFVDKKLESIKNDTCPEIIGIVKVKVIENQRITPGLLYTT